MAMSQGERLWRLQQSSNRFLSRQQTKDSSQQTLIYQAKASSFVFPENRTPSARAIETKKTLQNTDVGIPANGIGFVEESCCATSVSNGSETFSGSTALAQQKEGCAICANPDYATTNGYSIDLKPLGGVCCPLPNLPNTAQVPAAFQCASCLQFYFPNPRQPSICSGCSTPYPESSLYPPQPLDSELRRYGDIRVPQGAAVV